MPKVCSLKSPVKLRNFSKDYQGGRKESEGTNNIRNEKRNTTIDVTDLKKILREY